MKQLLVPAACWRAGERVQGVTSAEAELTAAGLAFPNRESLLRQAADWNALLVRDDQPPAALAAAVAAEAQQKQAAPAVVAVGAAGGGLRRRQPGHKMGLKCWPCVEQPQWPGGPLVPQRDGDGCNCTPSKAIPRF